MAEIWSIILPNLGWIVALIALLGVSYKIGRWMQEVEDRLEKLEKNPIIVAGNKLSAKALSQKPDLTQKNEK